MKKKMKVCVFYSWQGMDPAFCDKIIDKALDNAITALNAENPDLQYYKLRGGGGVVGSQDITDRIDEAIKYEANIAISDYTHTAAPPIQTPEGEWNKVKCVPNSNTVFETGKLEYSLGKKQIFKVYNTVYGDGKTNLDFPFDFRQEHYPIAFKCDVNDDKEARKGIIDGLKKEIIRNIKKCTEAYLENQKTRFAPLSPMHNEYVKRLYQSKFLATKKFEEIFDLARQGKSFRVLGLPGLGKTRLVGEAFRGRDYNVTYCDCNEKNSAKILGAFEKLIESSNERQVVILDNCSTKLCSFVNDTIYEHGYDCQLITINYDVKENQESGVESVHMSWVDNQGVVREMVNQVEKMPERDRDTIVEMAGDFPLMAQFMIDNFIEGKPISDVSRKQVFERMLNIDERNVNDQDKLKVMTAFSVFKYIGLYGVEEKHGRFIANNKIITPLVRMNEDENLMLFKLTYEDYSRVNILERQGNFVMMRMIPLAIYLCKAWFDSQTSEKIGELVNEIKSLEDEGTKRMLIDSISRRISLLAGVPLAGELNKSLTDPDRSPFLSEEVVLSTLGSRLFLAFSEVNPEACALALYRIVSNKTDEELRRAKDAKNNLALALGHMAFDHRSFNHAMLSLARMSLLDTDDVFSTNVSSLFIERYTIILPGTEMPLMERLNVINELKKDQRYDSLVKKALLMGLNINHDYRSGGAEKQGLNTLTDYIPKTGKEIVEYLNACLYMLMGNMSSQEDFDDICKAVTTSARGYYFHGVEDFLFTALEELVPQKDYTWEEMKEALHYIERYDAPKRSNARIDKIVEWKKKLTKDDYLSRLINAGSRIGMNYDLSFEKQTELVNEKYKELAHEFIDRQLYKDGKLLLSILKAECFHYMVYGMELSEYAKAQNVQYDIFIMIMGDFANDEVSNDGMNLFLYYFWKVEDEKMVEVAYRMIQESKKKRLLIAMYAIKGVDDARKEELFSMLDRGEVSINDFVLYYNFAPLQKYDVKYITKRLLDYGEEGASMVLFRCHHLLFDKTPVDQDYAEIGKRCLHMTGLKGAMMDDYLYIESVNNYFTKNRDKELALHIHEMMEKAMEDIKARDNYYLGRLYVKVLRAYKEALKPRIMHILESRENRYYWIEYLRTSYPQEGETRPCYEVISYDEWFDWVEQGEDKDDRAYVLSCLFMYSLDGKANPELVRLMDNYYSKSVMSGFSCRFHSYSWAGSGIPLYRSRIELCKDYAEKLTNAEAKAFFLDDIKGWEKNIEEERLRNANEKAIYG